MKKEIHPELNDIKAVCACGAEFNIKSTKKEIHVEVCSQCHPLFTGKQKIVDSEGRVGRFQKKMEKAKKMQSKKTKK